MSICFYFIYKNEYVNTFILRNQYLGIVGKTDFFVPFKKIVTLQKIVATKKKKKKKCYNIGIPRQTVCMAVNPITVDKFTSLFNGTTVGRSSD